MKILLELVFFCAFTSCFAGILKSTLKGKGKNKRFLYMSEFRFSGFLAVRAGADGGLCCSWLGAQDSGREEAVASLAGCAQCSSEVLKG